MRLPRNFNEHILFFLKPLYLLFLFFIIISGLWGEQLYFISGQPCAEKPGHIPYPTVIYSFDENAKSFDSVWSLESHSIAWSIDVYSDAGAIIISDGYTYPERVQILTTASIGHASILSTADLEAISNYYFFSGKDNAATLLISHMNYRADSAGGNPFGVTAFSIDSKGVVQKLTSMPLGDDLRLVGPYSPYSGGGRSDVISFRTLSDVPSKPLGVDYSFDGLPVPDSIVRMKHSFGWVMIANEPAFRAIMSVPERNGLTKRELLIYHKDSSIWHSFMIDGAETSPRLVNGWLVGVIADSDPGTDYTVRKALPSVLREDVVLINPLENQQFNAHLGPKSEVLWIEGSDVYYRVGDGLYRAIIQNDNFVDRTFLLTDPRIENIHWAFRGSMAAENK